MTEILRSCPAINRQLFGDGDKVITFGQGFGHYSEVIVYHTLLHGLGALLHDGSIIQIAPVSPYGGGVDRGRITIHTRLRVGDAKVTKTTEGIANKYWVITIPEETLAKGPLYSPELNATLFLPQHQEFAQHPGSAATIRQFLDNEVAERLNHMGHSGIVINAVDSYKRINTLYTCLHGRIVAIPVRYRVPTKDEQIMMRTMSLSEEVDPDGDPVQPYERIRLTYVLERKSPPYGRDIVETFSYSIPKLLRKSPNCWQLGKQWFSSDIVVLRRKLAEEPTGNGEMGFTQEAVNSAIADATHKLNLELEMTRSNLKIEAERAKRAEEAFKRAKELPTKVAEGEYDLSHVDSIRNEHELKSAKIRAETANAEATIVKAQSVSEKARHDTLSVHYAETQKTQQATWDTLGHVAKFALGGIMLYAAVRGIALKK